MKTGKYEFKLKVQVAADRDTEAKFTQFQNLLSKETSIKDYANTFGYSHFSSADNLFLHEMRREPFMKSVGILINKSKAKGGILTD